MKLSINNLDYSIKVGGIQIFLPNPNLSEYSIFQDLTTYLGCETNYDAEVLIKKQVKKDKLRVNFDSEADNVGIYIKKAVTMYDMILLLNELAIQDKKVLLTESDKEELKALLINWKRPKKQKWDVGDIFSIKLSNGSYAFAQIVEKYEDLFPVCILLEGTYERLPELKELVSKKIIALLSIVTSGLNDYTFGVVYSTSPKVKIPVPKRRDPVRLIQYSSSTLIELTEAFAGISPWQKSFDEMVIKDNLIPWLEASK